MNALKRVLAVLLVGLYLLSFCGSAFADNRDTKVFVTNTGTKYHVYGCSYLSKSCNLRTLEDAVREGYTACSRCNPPLPNFSLSSAGAASSSAYSKSADSGHSTGTLVAASAGSATVAYFVAARKKR